MSIGIFDSGVGGLTVLKEVRNVLPNEKIIYLGDTARVPYGEKTQDLIIRYSKTNRRLSNRKKSRCNCSSL